MRMTERLFAMDEMIRAGNYPSIADFTKRFEISERTAYGDIQYLKRHFHAPLKYSAAHDGYFYTPVGWSFLQAETKVEEASQEQEQPLAPNQWLWNEIERRFGEQAAQELHRDFEQYVYPQVARLCRKCQRLLPKANRVWCKDCNPRTQGKGTRTHYRQHKTTVCATCGIFLPSSHRKYCDTCRVLASREQCRKSYHKQSVEQRREANKRVAINERATRWKNDEWRQSYNATRRERYEERNNK